MSDTRVDVEELPTHPRTGLRAVGIGKRGPIWPIAGGSGEDEDDEDDGADDEDDAEDGEDDPFEGMDAEALKAVARKLAKANSTAKAQAKGWREFAQGKSETAPDGRRRRAKDDDEDGGSETGGNKPKGKTFTKADLREAMEEAEETAREAAMAAVLPAAAEIALRSAGIKLPKDADAAERRLSRIMKLMDTDDVTIVNGKLTGLDDAVDALKTEFPEYFGESRRRVPNPGNRNGGGGDGGKPKSTTERQAEAIFGRR